MMEQYEAAAREQNDLEISLQRPCVMRIQTTAKYCGFELTQTDIIRFLSFRDNPDLEYTCDVVLLYETLTDEDKKKAVHDKFMWDMRLENGQL
jgi:hypothetical protein